MLFRKEIENDNTQTLSSYDYSDSDRDISRTYDSYCLNDTEVDKYYSILFLNSEKWNIYEN